MRPIDADALVYDLYNDVPIRAFGSCKRIGDMIKYIEKRPTIDAVPVVRCKDCKWGGHCKDDLSYCRKRRRYKPSEFYCADGERREDDKDRNQ